MTTTENGALSYVTTQSAVLDFFFKTVRAGTTTMGPRKNKNVVSASEEVNEVSEEDSEEIPDKKRVRKSKFIVSNNSQTAELFTKALKENHALAMRALIHLRDPRGFGKGERLEFFRALTTLPAMMVCEVLDLLPEYGSYGDLKKYYKYLSYQHIKYDNKPHVLDHIINMFVNVIVSDVQKVREASGGVSLAAKWIPSNGSSVDKKTNFVTEACKKMGLTKAEYRKTISALRSHLLVVEKMMSSDTFNDINYSSVPSKAMMNYRKAFSKRDAARFCEYLASLKKGTTKINATGLMPHEIVEKYMRPNAIYDPVLEAQWKEMSSAFGKVGIDGIPVVDVSGSMSGTPMIVAIALGILVSENSKTHNNRVITFHEKPSIVDTSRAKNLFDKVKLISGMPWGGSTDFEATFEMLLNVAKMTQHVPKTLFVFSDMQFNQASASQSTNLDNIDSMFENAGFTRPQIVFWNLRGNTADFPAPKDTKNCALVSGFSANLLKIFLNTGIVSPWQMMIEVLDSPRYSKLTFSNTNVEE